MREDGGESVQRVTVTNDMSLWVEGGHSYTVSPTLCDPVCLCRWRDGSSADGTLSLSGAHTRIL